ncbi:MAG TPA: uroporphyrinogen decarboxylase family protein [Anaerolineae bacterium]
MNRRDRVLMALRHEQPDFTPYNFHATAAVYKKVAAHYGMTGLDQVAEFAGNHLAKIGGDFNVNPWTENIAVEQAPSGGPTATAADVAGGRHVDEFGCVWDRSGGMPHPVGHPLAGDPAGLDAYRMPDPWRAGRFDGARAVVERYRGDLFIFGKLGMALFERAWAIRGMQQLLVDMAERPTFVEQLLDRILYEWNLPIIEQQMALGVDGFYFADDWGSKTTLLFSPAMWRRFIKPRLALCYRRVKELGGIVGQHSDGQVLAVFPDLIEIGLDVFNPLQPSLYDLSEIKRRFGDRLAFYGGVDEDRTLAFGTPEDVRAEVGARAAELGRGGGYILQSSHTILDDVPLANIIAYIEACQELAGAAF